MSTLILSESQRRLLIIESVSNDLENSRNIMIRGAMNMLEDEGKEVTPENVNKIIRFYAPKILTFWMTHYWWVRNIGFLSPKYPPTIL